MRGRARVVASWVTEARRITIGEAQRKGQQLSLPRAPPSCATHVDWTNTRTSIIEKSWIFPAAIAPSTGSI